MQTCLPHWEHSNGFSPAWVQYYMTKKPGIFKGFYHTECTSTAFLSCDFSHVTSKLVLHWVHSNGFSPVWVQYCDQKTQYFQRFISHWVHFNCFSFVWFQSCNIKTCTTLSALKWLFPSVSPQYCYIKPRYFLRFYHTVCTVISVM